MAQENGRSVTLRQSAELVAASMGEAVLNSSHIQARVNMIQGAIKQVFKEGVHFGTIPGTPKPTLYKPGAEQLLVMFRIAAMPPKTEDLSTPDCVRYRVTREGQSQVNGAILGAGTGECSSDEEKYKWRRPVCEEEFEETAPDRRREVWKRTRDGNQKMKQIRTNPADVANTVLKMADKRALVAMTLVVTGASDAFAQDIEDLPEEIRETITEGHEQRPPVEMPKATDKPAIEGDAQEPVVSSEVLPANAISEPQRKRFYAIWKGAGKTQDEVKRYLKLKIGSEDDHHITKDVYEDCCKWAEKK